MADYARGVQGEKKGIGGGGLPLIYPTVSIPKSNLNGLPRPFFYYVRVLAATEFSRPSMVVSGKINAVHFCAVDEGGGYGIYWETSA